MLHQAHNRRQKNQVSSVLSTSAKAGMLACLAFAALPALTAQDAKPATATAPAAAQDGTVYGKVTNAATGEALQRAKVTVPGTSIETFTDEFGEYTITAPEGSIKVSVVYSGMKEKTLDVEVIGGETMMQDFNIVGAGIVSTGTGKEEVVMLDAFAVNEGRETNAYNIANNEQRYSVNIKNVVAADAFGDVTEGNIGEFIKYLPGISVDYVAADIRTINVRGFAAQFTNVSFNGMRITSAASGSKNRIVELEQVSINNVARAEVTKVPTPDQPADSLGGSVNMISKNAFESKGVSFTYKAYASVNAENLTFSKTPGPKDKDQYKIFPGADFTLVIPFSKKFGITLTGLTSNQFNEQHRSQMTWQFDQPLNSTTGYADTTKTAATPDNPHINQYEWQDGPKFTMRNSINLRADWRVAAGNSLSVGYQNNFYNNFFGNRNQRFTIGNTLAGTNAAINGIVPTSVTSTIWDRNNYVQSATGRGSVSQGSSYRNKNGQTQAGDIYYRVKKGNWEGDAGIHGAISKSWYRDLGRGYFNNVATTMNNVATVRLEGIDYPGVENIVIRNQSGGQIDETDLANYTLNSANTNELDSRATMKGGFFNVKRTFDVGIPLGVKTGISVREEDRDTDRFQTVYNFVGPDGVAKTADDKASLYASDTYTMQDSYWGLKPVGWVSPWKLAELYRTNPGYFQAAAGGADAFKYAMDNSEYIKERVSATYLQFDTKLFKNKLQLTSGVRFEKVEASGDGTLFDADAIYQRNADGSFVLDSSKKKVQKLGPTGGALTTLQKYELQYTRRGLHGARTYDGFYPSLHANYNITDDLIARFAYAKTYGRPDFADIIPTLSVPEEVLDAAGARKEVQGTITKSNPGLEPWMADNYDLSLEYYMPKGGTVQAGVFRKDLKGFWGTKVVPLTQELADEIGLDYDEYGSGWQLSSKFNAGNARISGVEFNLNQPLKAWSSWLKNFNLTANGTWLRLQGPNEADFKNFITRTNNIGLTWSKKPFVVMVKLNMRGRQRYDAQTGANYFHTAPARSTTDTDATYQAKMDSYQAYLDTHGSTFYEYYRARTFVDVNFEYQFSKKMSFFANVRNALNKAQDLIRENDVSAANAGYASQYRTEEYGLQWAIGVKGKF